jgi:hypothetical protein
LEELGKMVKIIEQSGKAENLRFFHFSEEMGLG